MCFMSFGILHSPLSVCQKFLNQSKVTSGSNFALPDEAQFHKTKLIFSSAARSRALLLLFHKTCCLSWELCGMIEAGRLFTLYKLQGLEHSFVSSTRGRNSRAPPWSLWLHSVSFSSNTALQGAVPWCWGSASSSSLGNLALAGSIQSHEFFYVL